VIPDLFEIGPFTLHSFGLMAALALILPACFVGLDLRDRGRDSAVAWEIAVAAGIGGFAGARINYLIANPDQGGLFSSTGLVWYGGVMGGFVGVVAVALWRRIPVGLVANTAAPALALGYAVGRIGCQLSGDGDYGSASSLPWAMSYPDGEVPTTDLVHPTPLYETTAMLVVFWLLWRLRARFDGPWALFGLWCILGGIERFLVEFIRRNDAVVAGLTTAQLISLGLVVLGAVILGTGRRRRAHRMAAAA
jgi:phosphatidylglycerol---prolipoprotein diacylglyceryl transferase